MSDSNNAKRILLVEDDRDLSQMVTLRLHDCGYEVIQCTDGDQAIREAKERKPDLLILDVFLPALDGFSVLKAIKNHLTRTHGGDDLPVIIITGRGVLMKDMFELEGVREFLQKPFEAAKLVEMVRQHME